MEENLSIKYLPIESLIPYDGNARTHSDFQLQEIMDSIRDNGWTNPILLDGQNGIVAGHGRLLAAQKLGLKRVPTIDLSFASEAKKAQYIIQDNKLALNAGWDFGILNVQFDFLEDAGLDLIKTGFTIDEILAIRNPEQSNEGHCDPDEVPGFAAEAITKLGDIWILGQHRLMCGDSTMIDQVEMLMNGEKADMVFTDPPYGINLETDYVKRYGNEKSSKASKFYGEDKGIDLNAIINNPLSINSNELFIWGADNYPDCLPRGGSWVVWDKSVEAVDGIASDFELCWSRERHHYSMIRKLWKGAKAREETGQEGKHKTRWGHPTQKPIELATTFFDKWGKKAAAILDYFGGSGTTLIACEKTNRKCYIMEISPQYCDVIIKRWQKFTQKQAILESTNQTFDEVANGESR
jgi:DNA modification methylase